MLQLGRRKLCRITSSYACASCIAISRSPSIISRRAIVASHHSRLLSTTIACRDAATPEASTVVVDIVADKAKPLPPKRKKKKKPNKNSPKATPPTAKVPLGTDAERQLKVLQGALTALSNVLATQGIDVGQIPNKATQPSKSTAHSPTKPSQIATASPDLSGPTATSPAKSKPKLKSKVKAARPGDGKAKAATTPNGPGGKVKDPKAEAQPSASPPTTAAAQTEDPVESRAPDLKAARPKLSTRKTPLRNMRPKSHSPPVKPSKPLLVRRVKSKPSDEPEQSREPEQFEQPRPANLGVPFGKPALATPLSALGTFLPPSTRKGNPFRRDRPAPPPKTIKGKPFTGQSPPLDPITPPSPPITQKLNAQGLALRPIQTTQPPVPSLSYGLDRVLFNPGVYQLQDPRSRVYNFDPYLSEIMPVNEFDFNALKQYVTSSKDNTLISIAKEHHKKYTGSTSSMTSMLAHFHYLLSSWRDINASMLSRTIEPESSQFTRIMKAPAATFLHWKDGTYAIDADKEYDTANILSMLGKSMEKLLTLSKDDYERYRHGNSGQITEEERNAEEAFHYTGFGDFMMRSQLDAYDPRIPGTGMFDLKTRAVISIRMDAKGYHKGLGYEIRRRFGQWESFEREYYDMIRSAFLKYSLQVRMGRMDGIFVAYHNTQRIFGFQYIPLTEMDLALHGTSNTRLGDFEFKVSLKLLNELLNRATRKWPEQSLRLHFETRPSKGTPFMYFFAEPAKPEEIASVQDAGKASVEAFEREILGLVKDSATADVEQPTETDVEQSTEVDNINEEDFEDAVEASTAQEMESSAAWEEARQTVEEAMDDDELGLGLVREAIGDALERSGILHARTLAESREYVDALIGAITGRTPTAQADVSTIDPNEEMIEDEDEHEEEVANEASTELDQNPSPMLSHSEAASATLHPDQRTADTCEKIDQATSTDSPARNPRDTEEEEEEQEEDDDYEEAGDRELGSNVEAKQPKEDVGSPSLEPLKSLIMRMARRIDERPISDADIDSRQDDASKLQEFERILGSLVSQSKTEQLERASGDSIACQNASSESDPREGAVDSESKAAAALDSQGHGTSQSASDKQPSQPSTKHAEEAENSELLALVLTIKNRVNGVYVDRPGKLLATDDWTVEYEIQDVKASRARKIYDQCKERRRKVFQDNGDKEEEWYKMFRGNLSKATESGREYRKQEVKKAEGRPMYMVGSDGPLQWGDVFRRQPSNTQTPDSDLEEDECD